MNREVRNPEPEIRNPKSQVPNADSAMDDLLVSFFRAEMPQPWPECSVQGGTESLVERNLFRSPRHPNGMNSVLRSRWVLAASVTILFIGSWWLGQRFAGLESTPSPTSSGKMIGSNVKPGKNKPPQHMPKTVVP